MISLGLGSGFFSRTRAISQSKHAGFWESGKLLAGSLLSRQPFRVCTSMSGVHNSTSPQSFVQWLCRLWQLCVCKVTLQSGELLEAASVRACRNLSGFFAQFYQSGSLQRMRYVLYCLSQPWFSAINTSSFAPLLSRGLVSMSQKVTSFTTPACSQLFNTVSNIWKSLITLTSTLTLAQGEPNQNVVPTFDVRQSYHLPPPSQSSALREHAEGGEAAPEVSVRGI